MNADIILIMIFCFISKRGTI